MGKASSNKKVQRAARAGGGGGRRAVSRANSSMLWPALVAVVVMLGIVLIVVSRNEKQAQGEGERPRLFASNPEDHWHMAFGINICGDYLADLPAAINSGIHTHGDGLIHVEAISSAETGKRATIGKFIGDYGTKLKLTDSELRLPDGKTYKNGDKCGSKPGRVEALLWDSESDKTPEVVTSQLQSVRIGDGKLVAFAFVPAGAKVAQPPSRKNLADPNAGERAPGTTAPPIPLSTPPTTAAAGTATTAGGTPPSTATGGTPTSGP